MEKIIDYISSDLDLNYHRFNSHGYAYEVSDLISLAQDLIPFSLDIMGIDIGVCPWSNLEGGEISYFLSHMKRVNDADLSYPIILTPEGYICDGWHRLCKAILNGDRYIQAVRLKNMPDRRTKI